MNILKCKKKEHIIAKSAAGLEKRMNVCYNKTAVCLSD